MSRTILIADDDAPIRAFVADLLVEQGYQVLAAEHGLAALAMLQRMSDLPQLILLDLLMPIMNGWDFRAAQLQDARLACIPVVLLSASHDLDRGAAVLHIPEYLAKPISTDRLLDVVDRYCSTLEGLAQDPPRALPSAAFQREQVRSR